MTPATTDRPPEIRLNVSFFPRDDESITLLPNEESSVSIPMSRFDEFDTADSDVELVTDRVYEIYCYRLFCRISRSSVLTLLLLITICFAMLLIIAIVVCSFLSASRSGSDYKNAGGFPFHGEDYGPMNWIHYPISDASLRHMNYTTFANAMTHHRGG